MQSRPVLALEAAGSCGVFSAYFQLAGAFDQAVGHPALVGGVVIGEGAGRQIERVAVRHAITRIDLAATGDKGEEQQQGRNSHDLSIRHRY